MSDGTAIDTGSPELILASYSWARRLHIVRLTRLRPFSVVSALIPVAPGKPLLKRT